MPPNNTADSFPLVVSTTPIINMPQLPRSAIFPLLCLIPSFSPSLIAVQIRYIAFLQKPALKLKQQENKNRQDIGELQTKAIQQLWSRAIIDRQDIELIQQENTKRQNLNQSYEEDSRKLYSIATLDKKQIELQYQELESHNELEDDEEETRAVLETYGEKIQHFCRIQKLLSPLSRRQDRQWQYQLLSDLQQKTEQATKPQAIQARRVQRQEFENRADLNREAKMFFETASQIKSWASGAENFEHLCAFGYI